MSDQVIRFTVPGRPVPKARPRFGGGGVFTDKRTKEYEAAVKVKAKLALALGKRAPIMPNAWPTDQRYRVDLIMVFDDNRRRDIDNCAKAILDAMNGVVYDDDSQIDQLVLIREKATDERGPQADIRIRIL